jgi:hypothetical protein
MGSADWVQLRLLDAVEVTGWLCVLPAAAGDPHAYRNRADDEQDAQELAARRVIDPPYTIPATPRAMARITSKYFMGPPFWRPPNADLAGERAEVVNEPK